MDSDADGWYRQMNSFFPVGATMAHRQIQDTAMPPPTAINGAGECGLPALPVSAASSGAGAHSGYQGYEAAHCRNRLQMPPAALHWTHFRLASSGTKLKL